MTGYRILLSKKFSEIPQSQSTTSVSVIQHPGIADEPVYKVQILQPAPSPLPTSNVTSALNTPTASHAPTPRSEPIPTTRILIVSEVTTSFIKSFIQSASLPRQKNLRRHPHRAILLHPHPNFGTRTGRLSCGRQRPPTLDEAEAAAATTTTTGLWGASTDLAPDRTQLIIDLGTSSISLSLLSIREGLTYILASSSSPHIRGSQRHERTSCPVQNVVIRPYSIRWIKTHQAGEFPSLKDARNFSVRRLLRVEKVGMVVNQISKEGPEEVALQQETEGSTMKQNVP